MYNYDYLFLINATPAAPFVSDAAASSFYLFNFTFYLVHFLG
eukprot:UN07849